MSESIWGDNIDPRKNKSLQEDAVGRHISPESVFQNIQNDLNQLGVKINKDTRILEVGSGNSQLTRHLHENGYDVVAVDARPRDDAGLPVAKIRIEQLPFDETDEKQRFDLVIAIYGVFDPSEYNQAVTAMFTEISRVLEVGGHAYVHVLGLGEIELLKSVPEELRIVKFNLSAVVLEKTA